MPRDDRNLGSNRLRICCDQRRLARDSNINNRVWVVLCPRMCGHPVPVYGGHPCPFRLGTWGARWWAPPVLFLVLDFQLRGTNVRVIAIHNHAVCMACMGAAIGGRRLHLDITGGDEARQRPLHRRPANAQRAGNRALTEEAPTELVGVLAQKAQHAKIVALQKGVGRRAAGDDGIPWSAHASASLSVCSLSAV